MLHNSPNGNFATDMVLVAWASKPVKPVKLFTPRF